MFKRRPKHASIALSLELVTMLPARIHQLGINVTAIRVRGAAEVCLKKHVFWAFLASGVVRMDPDRP